MGRREKELGWNLLTPDQTIRWKQCLDCPHSVVSGARRLGRGAVKPHGT